MKVLVIDGSSSSDSKVREICGILDEVLVERKVHHEIVHLEERRIVPCKGCMGCWVDTPGICRVDDDVNALNRSWMSSHLVVLLTRMTYGGYSSLIKNLLDKQIGSFIPYLIAGKGTVEHQARYERYPSILGMAVCDELKQCDSETFKMLVRQNGVTLHSHHAKPIVLWSDEKRENLKELIDSAVMGMKVGK